MKVTVFGIGYVGLVQGAVLAEVGHDVVCVDVDQTRVDNLEKGIIPIYEPGLDSLVTANFAAGRMQFTTDAKKGVEHGDVVFIAVGTPPDEDGSADLKYVLAVARTIAEFMPARRTIVTKSTVPVGTADKVKSAVTTTLADHGKSLEFDVVSNPEFLKEGSAVNDCMRPDRIILGTDSAKAEKKLRQLYAPFNRNHDKVIVMDIRSAELTKYAANCMLATKISFMNEMSNLAEKFGADIENVRRGIGSDPRIGYQFIYPGCGYGGSCFPKDVQALVKSAKAVGYNAKILEAVEAVNYTQKEKLFDYINTHFEGNLQGKKVALWGLSFKPNTDDMREASSRVLMEKLWAAGAKVQAYDPEAMEETQRIYGLRNDLTLAGTKEATLENADFLVICTEWQAFRAPDFELIKQKISYPVIFDGRNLYEPQEMQDIGFEYYAIGRGKSIESSVL
ncbi:UDP-glucose/GDP-mannose dehydrogenase family protein [Alteromonadaceae bacterium BrNp21-10]|nr:UDP-glucose/GDP-mannose dehydrogenase family protein [Alteromonadaceae bacterium BrNp21-10]